jgi:23S rRNA (pseudouridine1915-N3)-methyltransferase
MRISLICIGKTSFPFLREGIDLYKKRIDRYSKFEIIEIPDKKLGVNDPDSLIKREGLALLSKISDSDYLILLDDKGKQMTSEKLAIFIEGKINQPLKHIVFLVGGAYGFAPAIYERANASISLSLLTFSHQMVRLIFLEQLYRAFTILKGEPYHHN